MNDLTTTEKKLFNALTRLHNPAVLLGDKLQEMISTLGVKGTPVNAEGAYGTLTVSGVVIDGETVTINNPVKVGIDVYEFVTDAAKTKTVPTNIAVDIAASATKATATLTMDTKPTAGDTVTIGSQTFIFVPVGTANHEGEVSIGATLAAAQAALVAAINGTDGVNDGVPGVFAANFAANACVITVLVGGSAGNALVTTETFTAATNVFAAATFASGANCSSANAITALVAAINASDTQGVSAEDMEDGTILLTADVFGQIGNTILISDTMANGSFLNSATTFAGGVDATVSAGLAFVVDSTYLYVCLEKNTTADSNWRRISLGSEYHPDPEG